MSQQTKNGKGSKRALFLELSEESYTLLMKGQVSKSLEKIKEAETQLYRQVGKSAQSRMKVEISNMYYIKGLILDRMQELDKSLLAYRDAYQANPNNKSICNNLGKVHLQLHHYDEAEFYLRQALQLDDKLLQAYVNLAFLYFETRRLNSCIVICQEAMKRNIRDYMLHEYLGICHAELNQQFKESLEHLAEYMAACEKNCFKPSFLSLQYSGLGYFFYESKYEEALKYVNKAISMYPQERDALFLRAQIFYQLERIEEAEEDLLQYAVDSNLPFQIGNDIREGRQTGNNNIQNEDSSPEKSEKEIFLQKQKQQGPLLLQKASSSEERSGDFNSFPEEVTSLSGKTFKIKNTLESSRSERGQQIMLALGSPPRLRHQAESQVVNVLEQLNVYFVLGLIYMKAAGKKRGDQAKILQSKAKMMLEKAKILDPSKENMSILINEGMLQEQMGESENSFKTLESCQFLHFEKSNDEAYLNSENFHSINKIILHVFKLTLLQKFQENLRKLSFDKEIDAENYRGKKSLTDGKALIKDEQQKKELQISSNNNINLDKEKNNNNEAENNNKNNNNQLSNNINNGTPQNLTNRKRKTSLGLWMSVRFELEDPVKAVAADIEATKGEIMKTLIEQLNGLNKQRLVKIEKVDQKVMKTTMLDVDNSFISNPMCLTHNISNSIIEEDQNNNNSNNRSNMGLLASYLQTCENLDDEQKSSVYGEDIREERECSEEFENEMNEIKKGITDQNQKNNEISQEKTEENSPQNKELCTCEDMDEDQTDEQQQKQENYSDSEVVCCTKCGRKKKINEENEESKRQKIREQEKEQIILNAKHAYERELKDNNERIQQLKMQASRIKEQEYYAEKAKHYAKIKNIQKNVDDLSQRARVLLGLYNPSLFFTPKCNSCIIYRQNSRESTTSSSGNRKVGETATDTDGSREGSSLSRRSNNKQEQATAESTSGIAIINSGVSSSGSNTKPNCKCDDMKQAVERLSALLSENVEQRDLFFAFKRVARTVFLQSRSVIDMSYYQKRNITISSLAEMSLGFVPLFQPDMCKLNVNDTQMSVLNNEHLVKRCYFVISLADSLDDLINLFDSLSSVLSVILSPYVRDFLNNPAGLLWAVHMKSVFSVLKNFYEISFDQAGESLAYFIFYQFFAKFAVNDQDQEKYKSLQLQERSKFLFNFIRQHVSFQASDFFQIKKESISKSDTASSPLLRNKNNEQMNRKSKKQSHSSTSSIQSSYKSSEELVSMIQKEIKPRKDQPQSNDKCACAIF